jgi:hypothetical protein
MQTLVSQFTTSFVDDALELVKGFGKFIVQAVTAPIERIANACDVGGVLAERRLLARVAQARRQARPAQRKSCFSPFGSLKHLT